MFHISTEETYHDKQFIFREGNAGDWVYLIQSGSVEISKHVGEKKVVIEVLQQGDIFGELAYLAGIPRTTSAQAAGETTLGVIDRSFLDMEYNRLSGSFQKILKNIVLRLEKAMERTAESKLRRQAPRIPKVLSLKFKSHKAFINAFSSDLSAAGIFIKTPKPLPKDERFMLKLQLPETFQELKIICKVCWSRSDLNDPVTPPGMGVKFIEISAADRQKIKEELIRVEPKKQAERQY